MKRERQGHDRSPSQIHKHPLTPRWKILKQRGKVRRQPGNVEQSRWRHKNFHSWDQGKYSKVFAFWWPVTALHAQRRNPKASWSGYRAACTGRRGIRPLMRCQSMCFQRRSLIDRGLWWPMLSRNWGKHTLNLVLGIRISRLVVMNHLHNLQEVILVQLHEPIGQPIHVHLCSVSAGQELDHCGFSLTFFSVRFFFFALSSPTAPRLFFVPFSSPGTEPDSRNSAIKAGLGFLKVWTSKHSSQI